MSGVEPVAVILAAGSSSRFGSDKLQFALEGGASILEHSLRPYLANKRPVACVLRPDNPGAIAIARACSVEVLICANASTGMSASIAIAAEYAQKQCRPLMLGLGDMPFIQAKTVKQLLQAWSVLKPPILYPSYHGQQGHPVIFGCEYLNALQSLEGDRGGKALLSREAAVSLAVEDVAVVKDVDRVADL